MWSRRGSYPDSVRMGASSVWMSDTPGTSVTEIVERSPGPDVECPIEENRRAVCGAHAHGYGSASPENAGVHAVTRSAHAHVPVHAVTADGTHPCTRRGAAWPVTADVIPRMAVESACSAC